ncbi:uncharacterized protein MCYG_01309 [Microsporum canis CBS 113480]|uniref:Allergen Asp f 7 n=1 Tax=Arthroderma otae (strain ATCC MYA-4605 / CBS 113480) TaxID=554155 RepID=C5FF37_ARTOC|nr:uncharacterized protein MCYG_01309 [Microsporum canis CBS 113480]EEQ28421.1 hypothetical protein MCYG_01309 [Microsporum canis CBS 113480]
MAPLFKTLAAATALYATLATALPVQQKPTIWYTATDVVVKTITKTTTVSGVPGPDYTVPPAYTTSTTPAVPTTVPDTEPSYTPVPSAPTTTSTPPKETSTSYSAPAETSSTSAPPPTTTTTSSEHSSAERPLQPHTRSTTHPPPASTPPPESKPLVISVPPIAGGGSGYSGPCAAGAACIGEITFYDGGVGSCGSDIDTNGENAIALPFELMGPLSNNNPYCGKQVSITYMGKTTTATVKDKCMGCFGNNIDMTRKLFYFFGDESQGRIHDVEWHFI